MWSHQTLSILKPLATQRGTGVRLVSGMEASRSVCRPHDWLTGVDDFELCSATELPIGFLCGWRYTAPVVDMPTYLDYLLRRFIQAGGQIERASVNSIHSVRGMAPVVVNCTGSGAREAVPDTDVVPARGQLVVADNPGVHRFFLETSEDSPELTYFLPQGDQIILGGTLEHGRSDTTPRADTAEAIISRCAMIEPALAQVRVRSHRVGLRPLRPQVRVEQVNVGGQHVIHNYGHGGGGVSLSWGCALEVLSIVELLAPALF